MQDKTIPKDYQNYVKEKSPKPSMLRKTAGAFIIGGLICLLAQFIMTWLLSRGLAKEAAACVLTIIMIFLGALLTGFGVYDKIAKYAGAGTLIPITGFANAIVASAMEFKSEGYVSGLGSKMFTVAGPVIVFGTVSSVIVGLLYAIIA